MEIPPIILSGVVGALVAVVGNVIANIMANRAAARRQREQLQHDANQRRMEREMSLKREIFLDVADAMGQRIQQLFNVAQQGVLGPQQANAAQGESHKAVIGRAEAIASPVTLKVLHRAEEYYARSLLELLENQVTLNVTRSRVAQLEAEGEFYLKLITPVPNAALPEQFEQLLNKWSENQSTLEAVRRTFEEQQVQLFVEAVKRAQGYTDLLTEPMLAIRRELGIETDEAAFRQSGRSTWAESPAQMVEQLMGRVKKIIDDGYPSPDEQIQLPDGR